jgi:hypothetical protein
MTCFTNSKETHEQPISASAPLSIVIFSDLGALPSRRSMSRRRRPFFFRYLLVTYRSMSRRRRPFFFSLLIGYLSLHEQALALDPTDVECRTYYATLLLEVSRALFMRTPAVIGALFCARWLLSGRFCDLVTYHGLLLLEVPKASAKKRHHRQYTCRRALLLKKRSTTSRRANLER